jgi:DNA-binding GntR family transcriptional regulator
MEGRGVLYLKSLREQVYEYLREAINRGELEPGSFIDQNRLSAELGTSRTPLRDALIQLETEGFVTILPRRGVRVNCLRLDDIRHLYEIIGALEGVALMSCFGRIAPAHTDEMQSLNERMRAAVAGGDFDTYYGLNLAFHDVFLRLSDNRGLVRTVEVCKQRLYDFPRERDFVREWELKSTDEHAELVRLIESGQARAAADFLRDVHWSFTVQRPYIVQYYHAHTDGGRAMADVPADATDRS